jgi:hypothetical protein
MEVKTKVNKNNFLLFFKVATPPPPPAPLQAYLGKAVTCHTEKRRTMREGRQVIIFTELADGGVGMEGTAKNCGLHKVCINKEYHSVCPLVKIKTLPTPLSPASVLPRTVGGGAHLPAGEGLGESQFRRLEKKLSTLPTLWWPHMIRTIWMAVTGTMEARLEVRFRGDSRVGEKMPAIVAFSVASSLAFSLLCFTG